MKLLKAIAGISAIFILGAAVGALGTSLVIKHRVAAFHEKGPPPIQPLFMNRLSSRLELTAAQEAAVSDILTSTQKELSALRSDFRPRVKAIFSDCYDRIEARLTPPQKKELRIMKEHFPRFMHHGHPRQPPRHGRHRPAERRPHQPPPSGEPK
ncbi:MAG: hypothetical protein ACOCTS_03065 [Thermodesulfobacteriota bacterium]